MAISWPLLVLSIWRRSCCSNVGMSQTTQRSTDTTDYRAHPEDYHIGRGEQGVFHVEPYKSELLPLWAFRTPEVARTSSEAIYARFCAYRAVGDFVGMDMARKYLQMGYTRARRYANHRGGRKYGEDGTELPRDASDQDKTESAAIFKRALQRVLDDNEYQRLKAAHKERIKGEG